MSPRKRIPSLAATATKFFFLGKKSQLSVLIEVLTQQPFDFDGLLIFNQLVDPEMLLRRRNHFEASILKRLLLGLAAVVHQRTWGLHYKT